MAVRIGFVTALAIVLAGAGHADVARHLSMAQAPTPGEMAACRDEKARLQAGLAAVFTDYRRVTTPRSIAVLVHLDARIRALLRDRPRWQPCGDDEKSYDLRWQTMAVHLGYGNHLRYSGRLLVDAHKMDPKSPLRSHTLYSTVFGVTSEHGLGVMPNVAAAEAYAKEFPDGPFVKDAYETLADFHKDLFMVFRDGHKDYKLDCFAKYITSEPRTLQQARARRVALDYYARVLSLSPDDATVRRYSDALTRGVITAWSFCAD